MWGRGCVRPLPTLPPLNMYINKSTPLVYPLKEVPCTTCCRVKSTPVTPVKVNRLKGAWPRVVLSLLPFLSLFTSSERNRRQHRATDKLSNYKSGVSLRYKNPKISVFLRRLTRVQLMSGVTGPDRRRSSVNTTRELSEELEHHPRVRSQDWNS